MKKLYVVITILVFSISFGFSEKIVGFKVNGNVQTRTFVVKNLVGYAPGMKVDLDKLEKAQERLMNCGLFSNVFMNLEATGDDYILVIDVREKPHVLPYVNLDKGVGVRDNDLFGLNLSAYASIRFFNLLPFKLFWEGYSLGVNSLRMLGTPFSMDLEYSSLKKLQWQDENESFDYNLDSFKAGIGYTWGENNVSSAYLSKNVVNKFSVSSVLLSFTHKSYGDLRESYNWKIEFEHGLTMDYNTFSFDLKRYYRIIAQIYSSTRFLALYNSGEVPFVSRKYLGGIQNLKGYDLREFSAPFMALVEERIGMPLTKTFKISKSPALNFLTPEAITQLAFVESNGFKLSVGFGLKINTSFGAMEPEIFLGKKFAFYFEYGS